VVSQPLIRTSLQGYGVDISTGHISHILIEDKEVFHEEKTSLLAKAIELKGELKTDDTSESHQLSRDTAAYS